MVGNVQSSYSRAKAPWGMVEAPRDEGAAIGGHHAMHGREGGVVEAIFIKLDFNLIEFRYISAIFSSLHPS